MLYRSLPRSVRTIVCGDFNFDPACAEYLRLTGGVDETALVDTYGAVHGDQARPATFGCYDRTYMKHPVTCDHVFATRDVAYMGSR